MRRCLTFVNRVAGREYRPRDVEIRELCKLSGVTWPDPPPRKIGSGSVSETDLEDLDEEEMESEEETDDEEIEGT